MHPLYLTSAGAVVAAIALFFAIAALLRRSRLDVLARLPVAPEHRVELPAGDVVLHLAGPLGKRGLGALSFALFDAAGTRLPSHLIVMRTTRSSARGGVMLSVRRFEVRAAGEHRLRVDGIATDHDLSDCALLLARPSGAGLVAAIVGVVIAAVTLLVCVVLSLILWLAPEAFAPVGIVG